MSAIIRLCCGYRDRLEREIPATGIVVVFFGVNPSRADSSVRDQTALKWTGFANRWGAASTSPATCSHGACVCRRPCHRRRSNRS
ncbi:hypothetical protein BZM27_38925 [Paraburkholderia steynii]|uniref:DUF1643 domain-containing protein n=1 Tax=Paraburkholderia steynii TaxID=1245441 RepID=A0A4R0XCF8_9BURK|nr:hypothetical protein BZM27_38925 [Paraburkholderia steynii]